MSLKTRKETNRPHESHSCSLWIPVLGALRKERDWRLITKVGNTVDNESSSSVLLKKSPRAAVGKRGLNRSCNARDGKKPPHPVERT